MTLIISALGMDCIPLNNRLEVFIEHIPRAERQDACSAATIDLTSLPMHIEQGGYRVSLVPRPLGMRLLSRILCSCMAISKVWE